MRTSTFVPGIALLIIAGCGDQTGPTEALADPAFSVGAGASASGHAERSPEGFGLVERYSFTALDTKNGVAGTFEAHDWDLATGEMFDFAHGDVICLLIEADGKTAHVTGVVTKAGNPNNVGLYAVWTVVDNGEGANAAPDEASGIMWGYDEYLADYHCQYGLPPEWLFNTSGSSAHGNIQVRP